MLHFKSQYCTKLEKLKETDNFLDRYHLRNLNQNQISNINSPISPKEKEATTKSFPSATKSQGTELNQTFKEELLKLFQKIKTEGTFPNLFYEAIVILVFKPHKDSTKKDNFRLSFLINIDTKTLKSTCKQNLRMQQKGLPS